MSEPRTGGWERLRMYKREDQLTGLHFLDLLQDLDRVLLRSSHLRTESNTKEASKAGVSLRPFLAIYRS